MQIIAATIDRQATARGILSSPEYRSWKATQGRIDHLATLVAEIETQKRIDRVKELVAEIEEQKRKDRMKEREQPSLYNDYGHYFGPKW